MMVVVRWSGANLMPTPDSSIQSGKIGGKQPELTALPFQIKEYAF